MAKQSNYEYLLKLDTAKYKGEWVAIANAKVVAHGKEADKVYNLAKKKFKPGSISLTKTPNEQMLVLMLGQ